MDAMECIKTRRSVRHFTDRELTRETLDEIVSAASYAPSWKNSQTARWNIITDKELLKNISETAIMSFSKNGATIAGCAALAVESTVTGIAGFEPDGSYTTPAMGDRWEMYDAGIAAQTLCLAAHTMGVGSVIMGIVDFDRLHSLLGLPENEKVSAAIALGYYSYEPKMPPRKSPEEIARFF